ncbi:M14 family zinc carboxypeptidase [Roseisolibacter agri]|uniref:Peptidase M14 n=1 Tax=Roseisolibacter agri TaxID=2014610 RepID=A0AA37V190_9BACT|nr:M14 family zinc carboxypeptidase [Roseisolibacter agri]GLC25810.1 peptidase M14 [Roseisolibacter agri]
MPPRLRPLSSRALAATAALTLAGPAAAQHALAPAPAAAYDPAIPTPRAVLGYDVGERFTPHHLLMRYVERVAQASPRVKVDTLGRTAEGREVPLVAVTSAANAQRLAAIRADARRLADPATLSADERRALVARTPAVVWLGYSVHGNEASGVEAGIAMLYQLAAGRDAETQAILDSTVVLIDPAQNPDGHERHAQDVMRGRGAFGVTGVPGALAQQGSWPGARGSHYYFDLNRDWFIQSHPETRARIAGFLGWMPHVAVDLHEMGSNSSYFFAPPMEPMNQNVPASVVKWWDVYAAANGAAFDRHGWAYFRREGYDEFYPGYGVSWPILTGATGMTFEQASSGAGAIRRTDGTVMTLHEAARHHYTAAWATTLTTAQRRTERVADYAETRATAPRDATRGGMRAVILERDADGRADSLAALLARNAIVLRRTAGAPALAGATAYTGNAPGTPRFARGAWIVDLAQPQGRLARALLEPDAVLDSTFIRGELERRRSGQSSRFYDVTAWTLPYAWRVRAWTTSAAVAGAEVVAPETLMGPAVGAAPTRASYAYAVAPGSEASLRWLAGVLADSVRVWHAPRSFRVGNADFPRGAFIVRVGANDSTVHTKVARRAAESGATVAALSTGLVDAGTDLGSGSVVPVRAPRIALLGGAPVNGTSFGFAWFALDQRVAYPSTAIGADALAGSALSQFDVLVVPSVQAAALDRQLGDGGRARIADWVRGGGTLVTLGTGSAWLTGQSWARLKMRRDTSRTPGAEPGAPLPVDVPGAAVRVLGDPLSPLLAGVDERELAVMMDADDVFQAPRDLRPGEVVLRHAPVDRLRLAGYLWPEMPARLAGSPWLWTERLGQGRLIAFAGDPNFRDLWRGLLPIFGNALFLGNTF